jgi:beta-glucosidase/6-phospho-beta-glucosidase/beta-galactosidase
MHPLILNGKLPDPGFFALNFGWQGPLAIFGLHFVYGVVMGSLYRKPVGYSVKKEEAPLQWQKPKQLVDFQSISPAPLPDDFMFTTGIECSYPTIDKGRWRMDELDLTRHYRFWEKDLELVAKLKIPYLRYGPPIHWIFRGPGAYDWSFLDAVMGKMQKLGITPIIDLCHFGLPKWLENFQNSEFPRYLQEYAIAMAKRYPWIRFWNPCNEIYVTARESTLQGNWNEAMKSERAFVTATGHMVEASHRVVQSLLELRKDVLFFTSESSEFYQACCPDEKIQKRADFENQRRFISCDLLYAHPVREDIKDYLFQNGMPEARYQQFMQTKYAKHMIMGLDYYDWNEKLINIHGEIESLGELFGWYVITKQYYDRYQRPLFHSETNLQDARQGAGWLWRQWHNVNLMLADGIPVVGFTWYSLQDQVDWNTGLSEALGNINPVGLFDLNREARETALGYLQILRMFKNKKLDLKLVQETGL